MEPERKIEKLLRAYAKKRRDEAGEPLKLHPATRRLLQSEAARVAPKPDRDDSVSLWQLFRQEWAMLLGFAFIVFLGATLFISALSSAKNKAQRIGSINNLKQIGIAVQMAAEDNNGRLPASLDALTNGLLPANVLTDAASGQRFAYLGGGEKLDSLQSNAVLAYSPAEKDGRAVLFADGRVELASPAQFSDLTNQKSFQLATARKFEREPVEAMAAMFSDVAGGVALAQPELPMQTKSAGKKDESKTADAGPAALLPPAAAPETVLSDRLRTTQELSYRNTFEPANPTPVNSNGAIAPVQAPAGSFQNSFRNAAGLPQAMPVLANFQVEQNGGAIRVVDGDGSVYAGSLLPGTTVVTAANQKKAANNSLPEAGQIVSFRVSGLNRTLQQNVVFAADVVPISNASPNSQQNLGGTGQPQQVANQQQELLLSNYRIVGMAMIGLTNQIEINAVPLAP